MPGYYWQQPWYEAATAALRQKWDCDHARVGLRHKISASGARFYVRQCLRCGCATERVPKAAIGRPANSVPPFDEVLAKQYGEDVRAAYAGLRDWAEGRQEREDQEQDERWWRRYNAYIQSPAWQEKRQLVMARAGGRCEGCAKAPAVQVHHLTYVRVGDELLFDLVAVCLACHQKAHPDKRLERS